LAFRKRLFDGVLAIILYWWQCHPGIYGPRLAGAASGE
jgi:hypothetical protein